MCKTFPRSLTCRLPPIPMFKEGREVPFFSPGALPSPVIER